MRTTAPLCDNNFSSAVRKPYPRIGIECCTRSCDGVSVGDDDEDEDTFWLLITGPNPVFSRLEKCSSRIS
jgi:hypothetical protein